MIDIILDTLLRCWLFDVRVYSSPWLYIPLLIPAMFYTWFFIAKWVILTLPVWLPLRLVVDAFSRRKTCGEDEK